MSVIVSDVKKQLFDTVNKAVSELVKSGELPDGKMREYKTEVPADRKNGDFSANVAMVNSKEKIS